MSRVKRGLSHLKRRRSLMKRVKGFEAGRNNLIKLAKTALLKAGVHAYRDRKVKKREFRRLWIVRLNAACRESGISYSRFIKGLTVAKVGIDRKVLSEIAINSPDSFKKLIDLANANLK